MNKISIFDFLYNQVNVNKLIHMYKLMEQKDFEESQHEDIVDFLDILKTTFGIEEYSSQDLKIDIAHVLANKYINELA